MTQQRDFSRLEIKFVGDESQVHVLNRWLALRNEGLEERFPGRWVNNVYFDTHDYLAFRQNMGGASDRYKVRYRWYEAHELPAPGALEVKRKRNFFSWKLRFPADTAPCEKSDYWTDVRRKLLAVLPEQAGHWIESNPQPVILNRYYRRYLATPDNAIRLTLDMQNTVYDQRYKPYPNITHAGNMRRTVVLEMKFARSERVRASQLMRGLPLRVSRHSKYVICLRSVQGF